MKLTIKFCLGFLICLSHVCCKQQTIEGKDLNPKIDSLDLETFRILSSEQSLDDELGDITRNQFVYNTTNKIFAIWEEVVLNDHAQKSKTLFIHHLENQKGSFQISLSTSNLEKQLSINTTLISAKESEKASTTLKNVIDERRVKIYPLKNNVKKLDRHVCFSRGRAGQTNLGLHRDTPGNDYRFAIKGAFFESSEKFAEYLSLLNEIPQNFKQFKEHLKNKEIHQLKHFFDEESMVYLNQFLKTLKSNNKDSLDMFGEKYRIPLITNKVSENLKSKDDSLALSLDEVIYYSIISALNLETIFYIEYRDIIETDYQDTRIRMRRYLIDESNNRYQFMSCHFLKENKEWKLNLPSLFEINEIELRNILLGRHVKGERRVVWKQKKKMQKPKKDQTNITH